jgi:prophage antirepressor-like protein
VPSSTALVQTSAEILKTFDFDDLAVRTVTREGAPWFVAADVCRVLDIANDRDATSRLDDDEKSGVGIADTRSKGGSTQRREMTVINESGLYALILTSRKPSAKRFRKWITAEVIPAIRQTGSYGVSLPAKEKPILVVERPDNRIGQLIDATERLLKLAEGSIASRSKSELAARTDLPPFAAFIRKRRHELDLSVQDFAYRCGMSYPHAHMLESGRSPNPTLKTLQALCAALDCDMNALTGQAPAGASAIDEDPETTVERLADQMADALDKLEGGRWFARVYPRSVQAQPFHLVSVKIYGRK